MAHNPSSRRSAPRRASRAPSTILSDSPFVATPTPRPTPPPHLPPPLPPSTTRRSSTRGIRANSALSDAQSLADNTARNNANAIPSHYSLPPTAPSPFSGTLEASLDAVLDWGAEHGVAHAHARSVVIALLQPASPSTNWAALLQSLLSSSSSSSEQSTPGHSSGRHLVEELLFLVTRTLLPEQIAENRGFMARLYDRRKQLAIRLVLRYDMLREWRAGGCGVASVPPPLAPASSPSLPPTSPSPSPTMLPANMATANATTQQQPSPSDDSEATQPSQHEYLHANLIYLS